MYDNLRADLGPDYEEIERGIRVLRSLDPRRELDSYGRKMLSELAEEAGADPQTLLHSNTAQLSQSLRKSVIGTIESGSPAKVAATAQATEPESPGSAAGADMPADQTDGAVVSVAQTEDALLESLLTEDVPPAAPEPHAPDPTVSRLGHDLLSDALLDRPLKEAISEQSPNGHEPS
jgi:hypothetical protein